jgi:hypothetical protein
MRRGLDVMLCCLGVSGSLTLLFPLLATNNNVAIDTNIFSSVDKEHFDEDTFSRLQ